MKKLFLYTLTTAFILTGAHTAMADNHGDHDKGAMFEKLDTNGDGNISSEEFVNKRMERKEKRQDKMIEEIDTDADGVISEDEFLSKSRERFSKLDADSDGKVTKEEAQAHRKAKKAEKKEMRKERREAKEASE